MTPTTQLERDAAALVTRLPTNRAEAMVFCLGFLDQAVKCYLRGDHNREDLARNRELVELTLDLHRDQRG